MSHRLKYKDTSGQCLIIIHNYKHYKFLRTEKRIKFYKLRSNEALEEATLAPFSIGKRKFIVSNNITQHNTILATEHKQTTIKTKNCNKNHPYSSPKSVSMSMNPGPKPS